jgi:hypothetical protein
MFLDLFCDRRGSNRRFGGRTGRPSPSRSATAVSNRTGDRAVARTDREIPAPDIPSDRHPGIPSSGPAPLAAELDFSEGGDRLEYLFEPECKFIVADPRTRVKTGAGRSACQELRNGRFPPLCSDLRAFRRHAATSDRRLRLRRAASRDGMSATSTKVYDRDSDE